MSRQVGSHLRQWVAMPGASCDLRVGEDLLDEAGALLKGAAGRPHVAALVMGGGVGANVAERVRRQLTSVGFDVRDAGIVSGNAMRTLAAADKLATRLAELAVTADDLIVAVGSADALSVCALVAGSWQGGTTLAVVPTSLDAAVMGVVRPPGLDVGTCLEALAVRGSARHALCDLSLMDLSAASTSRARACMAAVAMCESERAFGLLWDRAAAIAAGNAEDIRSQLAATVKGLGQLTSSASAAVRTSAAYGLTFARALTTLAPSLDEGIALGEGLRFCARLSAAMGTCSVDDVLAQDELLDRLGIGLAACRVDAASLADAIRAERFRRTNRLMLELPRSLGKVRLAAVTDELLAEHAQAWCDVRCG